MPRPPTKRNRLTSKVPSVLAKESPPLSEGRDDSSQVTTSKPPLEGKDDTGSTSQLGPGAQAMEAARQARNQTPMTKGYEQAIGSSPSAVTGSRPFSRARGYSSTLSVGGRKGDIGSKVHGTPAFESSILSNFRRRPRQPSILQMMQAEDGSSDLDDEDFLGGLSPEDESTPLNLSRGKSLVVRTAASLSPDSHSSPSSAGSHKRKRSTGARQVSHPHSDIVEDSPIGSPSTKNRQEQPQHCADPPEPLAFMERFSQTMASPLSSGRLSSPAYFESIPRPSHVSKEHTKTSHKATNENFYLTTAALQDKLLPRRRRRKQRRRNEPAFEVPTDSDADDYSFGEQDDDELSYLPTRGALKSQLPCHANPQSHSGNRARKNKHKTSEVDSRVGKLELPRKSSRRCREQSKPRGDTDASHARRFISTEKENQPMDVSSPLSSPPDSVAFDSDSESTGCFLSEELKLQAKKFADVDKWQMEFEDVSIPADSQGHAF